MTRMRKNMILLSLMLVASVEGMAQAELVIPTSKRTVEQSWVGTYDRVRTKLSMMKDAWYLVILPAPLDGYYFGPDAMRLKVTEQIEDAGEVTKYGYQEMDDKEDFRAGDAYLVCPTTNITSILHITPGISTEVPAELEGKEIGAIPVDDPKNISGIEETSIRSKVSPVYDLQGRVVTKLQRGEMFIIDGKKVRF